MNIEDLEHKFNGTQSMPKCNDLYALLGAVKIKDDECPNCGEYFDNEDQYEVNNETYPKYYNESKGATVDGRYWYWDEVHCCKNCKTKYWFRNGAY